MANESETAELCDRCGKKLGTSDDDFHTCTPRILRELDRKISNAEKKTSDFWKGENMTTETERS